MCEPNELVCSKSICTYKLNEFGPLYIMWLYYQTVRLQGLRRSIPQWHDLRLQLNVLKMLTAMMCACTELCHQFPRKIKVANIPSFLMKFVHKLRLQLRPANTTPVMGKNFRR